MATESSRVKVGKMQRSGYQTSVRVRIVQGACQDGNLQQAQAPEILIKYIERVPENLQFPTPGDSRVCPPHCCSVGEQESQLACSKYLLLLFFLGPSNNFCFSFVSFLPCSQ